MDWRDGADSFEDSSYAAPKVTQHELDAGGNYVTPAWASKGGLARAGDGGIKPLGSPVDTP